MIYLDYQATTVLAPEAEAAMTAAMAHYGNPNSAHRIGRLAAADVELARDRVRAALGKMDGTLVFTSGATEALNWALVCGAELASGGLAGSAIEHHAALQRLENAGARLIPVGADGLVPPPDPTSRASADGGSVEQAPAR